MTSPSRRSLPLRYWILVAVSVLVALACARLGVWQLSRLGERRARNASVVARFDQPAVTSVAALPADTAAGRFRRVQLLGLWDYEREIVIAGRTRQGSPGVNIVTPVRPLSGAGPALLVNRGWVYSPNGAAVELARWREGDTAHVDGFAVTFRPALAGNVGAASHPRAVRWLDSADVARRIESPLRPYVVVQDAPGWRRDTVARRDSTPARVGVPRLDEGSHLSYAVQWFSFAGIALVGLWATLRGVRRGTGA